MDEKERGMEEKGQGQEESNERQREKLSLSCYVKGLSHHQRNSQVNAVPYKTKSGEKE